MKILDTSNATATIVQPVKAETLNFLQTASKEIVSMVLNSVTGIYPNYNTTVIVVLTGCVGTLTAGVYNITAGVVWFNGEVFNVLANTFTPSGGQTPIFQLQTTQDTSNADPLTFSDQVQRNVHNIRQMQVIAGTSGSANYVLPYSITSSISCVYLGLSIPQIQAALNSEISRATSVEQTLNNKINYINGIWGQLALTSGNVGKTGAGAISSISGFVYFSNNVANTTIGNIVLNITAASSVDSIIITMPVTWEQTTVEMVIETTTATVLLITKTINTNTIIITTTTGISIPAAALSINGSFIGQTTT